MNTALLSVRNLEVRFHLKADNAWFWQPPAILQALNRVSFEVNAGETLGIVGESGCGKSTLARAVVGLVPVHSGQILWEGQELIGLSAKKMRQKRQHLQMIFQDPLASLNPRMTVGDIIAEPLRTFYPRLKNREIDNQVKQMMLKVGLLPNLINRYPHEFSGGQCQRIGIARALILKPKLLICDEPVSALDVSIQAQVVNLLKEMQQEMGLALLFIAHDLSVVQHISDRVLVMYLGHAVELGSKASVYHHAAHPYTQALLSAVPLPDPIAERHKTVQLLHGELPSPIHPPAGCAFHTRCPIADIGCTQTKPLLQGNQHHAVACLKNRVP